MVRERHALDASLPFLSSLGIESVFDVLQDELHLDPRQELLARERGYERYRYPLPGTPGADGRLTARPGPAGTGWVILERWIRTPWRELMEARFTDPRSTSMGERRWNLLCYLRASGVATAGLRAVGALGSGPFARRSFLIMSELKDYVAFPEWMASETDAKQRERGVVSLGASLARLAASGVELPRLVPEHFALSRPAPDSGGCKTTPPPETPGGLTVNPMPSVVLTEFRGARFRGGARSLASFTELFDELLPAEDRALLSGSRAGAQAAGP